MEADGVFGHVNASIRKLATDGPPTQTWEFLCECPDIACHALVSLTLDEFDERRAAAQPVPVLATPHPAPPPDRTVSKPIDKPKLVFFYSPQSGRCRRVDGFIAQVLQRRSNHSTFQLVRVAVERHPDLAERFGVKTVPTLCVVEGRRLRKRIAAPGGCRELERELAPWLH